MGSISVWQLLVIAAIVVLLFGTHRLRGLGGDLGVAIKGFKNALGDEPSERPSAQQDNSAWVPKRPNETIHPHDDAVEKKKHR